MPHAMSWLVLAAFVVGIAFVGLAVVAPGTLRRNPALRAQQASLGVFFLCEAAQRGGVLPQVFGPLGVVALLATLVASTVWAIRTGGA